MTQPNTLDKCTLNYFKCIKVLATDCNPACTIMIITKLFMLAVVIQTLQGVTLCVDSSFTAMNL